jgi:alcohol dehydrogenase
MELITPRMLPQTAILDPRCTTSLPAKITAATGLDALTHALEALTCRQANPLSRVHALAAVELVRDHLENAVLNPGDKESRHAMALAAYLAGVSFSNSMVGAVHALGHGLGAVAHLPHGVTMELMLLPVLRHNQPVLEAEFAELARLWHPEVHGELPHFLESLESFVVALRKYGGLPSTLTQAGVTREQLPAVVERAWMDGSLLTNPVELSKDDLLALLEAAF